jgi:hypothetical protein
MSSLVSAIHTYLSSTVGRYETEITEIHGMVSVYMYLLTYSYLTERPKSGIQCSGSGMFIPDPGSQILIFTHPGSRILDPGSKNSNKREG